MSGTAEKVSTNVEYLPQGKYADALESSALDTASAESETTDNKPSTSTDRQDITYPSDNDLLENDDSSPTTEIHLRIGGHHYTSVYLPEKQQETDEARHARYASHAKEIPRWKVIETETWEAKRKEPIQAHLEALHRAYGNVDPEYTVFAFGGTIPPEEVDAGNLSLHVARWGSLDEVDTRFDGQMRKQGEAAKNRKKAPGASRENEDILEKIAHTLHMPCKLRAERAKLNIYREGGFFRAHCDTPRSSEHIGTIVVGLPGAYLGGSLRVDHGGPGVEFEWGTSHHDVHFKKLSVVPSTKIRWAFLYGDCKHKVSSVDQGARLSVAYDVFTIPEIERDSDESTAQSDEIYQALQVALADHKGFAEDGCMLAFGLSHSYPQTTESYWKGLETRLKGPDAVVLQAVRRSHLNHSFKAAFQLHLNSRGSGAKRFKDACDRGLSDAVLFAVYRNGLDRYEIVLADRPDQVEGQVEEAWNETYLLENLDCDQQKMPQLVWVDYPVSYGFKNRYTYIGNGPCDPAEAYSGVVMLVHIPPANKR